MEVGAGLLHREDRAPHHHHVVQPDTRQLGGDVGRHLGRDAGPRRQLVARQAHTDDGVRTRRVANRRDHPTRERQSVGPLVTAMVRETRHELANEAVLSGVDLHAVTTRRHCNTGGIGETGDDDRDVLGLHPLGHLAAVHLGNARRRPQGKLRIRGRALTTGMIEAGDHQRAVRVARVGDGAPSGAARGCQRRAFVRPIAGVHAGALGDDDAASTSGPTLVVGDVPRRESAFVVAEIGDVRTEHDPVRGRATPECERGTKIHRRAETGLRERVTGLEWSIAGFGAEPGVTIDNACSPSPPTHSGSGPSSGIPVKNFAAMHPP